ncbi:MAG: hypothetical protein ACE5IJ_02225 [Thermoplasmata archaeon]
MKRSTTFALLAIFLFSMFLRLLPLTRYLFWGADIGEYYHISTQLTTDGSISETYGGWGFAYPFFPGMEIVVAGSSLLGMELSLALSLIIPILASLIVFPGFLLTTEITRDDRAGLVAAAFLAVVMPHVYPTSHPMPAALGDLLFATCLFLFYKWLKNPKFGFLLFPATLALIVTHHLSTYFLLISLIFGIFLVQLLRNRTSNARLARELAYILFTAITVLLYWFVASPGFTERIALSEGFLFSPVLLGMLALASVVALLVVHSRRRFFPNLVFRYPTYRRTLASYASVFAVTLLILLVSALVVVPGTTVDLPSMAAVLFFPLILFASFAGPGTRPMSMRQGGLYPLAWTLAISLSTLAGIFASSKVLIPYRHIEYLMFPLAILAGVGFAHTSGLIHFEGNRKRTSLVTAFGLGLVLTNAFAAYPPRDIMAGYDEGMRPELVSLARWSGEYADDLTAADHRVSSMLFGFGDVDATWDTATLIFHSPDFEDAKAELEEVDSPSGMRRAIFVAFDQGTVDGVQLYPWDPAEPMSDAAVSKFEEPPFQRVYDDGYSKLYYLNWGLA